MHTEPDTVDTRQEWSASSWQTKVADQQPIYRDADALKAALAQLATLPPLVEVIRRKGKQVLWCCDPMHGNTETTSAVIKTRRFGNILGELEASFRILKECGGHLGGVHIELTGENVTECVGGASGVTEADLTRDYRSQLDPRLNYEQAMELALALGHLMARDRG